MNAEELLYVGNAVEFYLNCSVNLLFCDSKSVMIQKTEYFFTLTLHSVKADP